MALSNQKRACEPCRRRKVKCDGLPTCHNCSASGIACEYSIPKKRGPKPARWRDVRRRERPGSVSAATEASLDADRSAPSPVDQAVLLSALDNSPAFSNEAADPVIESSRSQAATAVRIHLDLLKGLAFAAPSETSVSIANHCIFLYSQYVFGTVPVCHEARLRTTVSRCFIQPGGEDDQPEYRSRILGYFEADSERERVAALRAVTLLTALCASVAYSVPTALLPYKHHVAPLFLRASRSTLQVYEDYDLEHPDSSSLSIRLFLSSAIQIATGKQGLAFHTLNEAGLIALRMRLYDESSLEGLDPVEGTILRNAFWQLYICDKTAVVMKGRPITIHEALFDSALTLQAHSQSCVPLFHNPLQVNDTALEDRLLEGFHIIRRLWAMAAQVIQVMESDSRSSQNTFDDPGTSRERIAQLSRAYFEMVTLTNSLLLHATSPEHSPAHVGQEFSHHLTEPLLRQRTSYLMSLHCVKIFVTSAAVQSGMTEIIGLSAEPLTLAMKQIEMAQDFLNVLDSVPFVHLQAEGEQCAEKIRRIGSLLLRLECSTADDTVKRRANHCAMRFIDILVRLDSKASELLE